MARYGPHNPYVYGPGPGGPPRGGGRSYIDPTAYYGGSPRAPTTDPGGPGLYGPQNPYVYGRPGGIRTGGRGSRYGPHNPYVYGPRPGGRGTRGGGRSNRFVQQVRTGAASSRPVSHFAGGRGLGWIRRLRTGATEQRPIGADGRIINPGGGRPMPHVLRTGPTSQRHVRPQHPGMGARTGPGYSGQQGRPSPGYDPGAPAGRPDLPELPMYEPDPELRRRREESLRPFDQYDTPGDLTEFRPPGGRDHYEGADLYGYGDDLTRRMVGEGGLHDQPAVGGQWARAQPAPGPGHLRGPRGRAADVGGPPHERRSAAPGDGDGHRGRGQDAVLPAGGAAHPRPLARRGVVGRAGRRDGRTGDRRGDRARPWTWSCAATVSISWAA